MADDRLDPELTLGEHLVGPLLLPCPLLAAGLLRRPEDHHRRERAREEAESLSQPALGRQGGRGPVGHARLMHGAARGVAQQADQAEGSAEQDIVDGVVVFLAALTRLLFSRVLGADDASLRPVMGTRGASGVATGATTTGAGAASNEPTTEAASASETPSRWARAVRDRAGASPRVRRAASRAGRRTWSH